MSITAGIIVTVISTFTGKVTYREACEIQPEQAEVELLADGWRPQGSRPNNYSNLYSRGYEILTITTIETTTSHTTKEQESSWAL